MSDTILGGAWFNDLQLPTIHDIIWLTYGPGQMLIVYSTGIAYSIAANGLTTQGFAGAKWHFALQDHEICLTVNYALLQCKHQGKLSYLLDRVPGENMINKRHFCRCMERGN